MLFCWIWVELCSGVFSLVMVWFIMLKSLSELVVGVIEKLLLFFGVLEMVMFMLLNLMLLLDL